jgi:hypothetical protein
MTINDQYNRRREQQQSIMREAQQHHLRYSNDPRLQKSISTPNRLSTMVHGIIMWLKLKFRVAHTETQQKQEVVNYQLLQTSYDEHNL